MPLPSCASILALQAVERRSTVTSCASSWTTQVECKQMKRSNRVQRGEGLTLKNLVREPETEPKLG